MKRCTACGGVAERMMRLDKGLPGGGLPGERGRPRGGGRGVVKIHLEAEGDREHFERLMAALAGLVEACYEKQVPLAANVTTQDDDEMTIVVRIVIREER